MRLQAIALQKDICFFDKGVFLTLNIVKDQQEVCSLSKESDIFNRLQNSHFAKVKDTFSGEISDRNK